METWGWLVLYVVGFGLVQLLLYRHFQRDDASPDVTPPADRAARRSLDRSAPSADEEGIHCHHCGTYNEPEPTFSYCKECVRPLR